MNCTERNLHEIVDNIPQVFTTDNLAIGFHDENKTNGDKSDTLLDNFPLSSIGASQGFEKLRHFLSIRRISRVEMFSHTY